MKVIPNSSMKLFIGYLNVFLFRSFLCRDYPAEETSVIMYKKLYRNAIFTSTIQSFASNIFTFSFF